MVFVFIITCIVIAFFLIWNRKIDLNTSSINNDSFINRIEQYSKNEINNICKSLKVPASYSNKKNEHIQRYRKEVLSLISSNSKEFSEEFINFCGANKIYDRDLISYIKTFISTKYQNKLICRVCQASLKTIYNEEKIKYIKTKKYGFFCEKCYTEYFYPSGMIISHKKKKIDELPIFDKSCAFQWINTSLVCTNCGKIIDVIFDEKKEDIGLDYDDSILCKECHANKIPEIVKKRRLAEEQRKQEELDEFLKKRKEELNPLDKKYNDVIAIRPGEYGIDIYKEYKKKCKKYIENFLLSPCKDITQEEQRLRLNLPLKEYAAYYSPDYSKIVFGFYDKKPIQTRHMDKETNHDGVIITVDINTVKINNKTCEITKMPDIQFTTFVFRNKFMSEPYELTPKYQRVNNVKPIKNTIFYIRQSNINSSIKPEDMLHIDTEKKMRFDFLEGHEFEEYCANLLKDNGYTNVEVTQGSGDYGIDIIAYKNSLRYGIQCKRYTTTVGVKAVQEASSGSIYYECDRAMVMTNQFFTPQAQEFALKTKVELVDRMMLIKMLE